MEKPIINEVFADNGEHSHWELIDSESGKLLWSEDITESTIMRGEKTIENEIIPYHARYKEPLINPFSFPTDGQKESFFDGIWAW